MNCPASNTPGLDANYPYQGGTNNTVTDAPFNPLLSTYATSTRNFAATMYLMWQSNTTGSIPVPMGSVAWGFSGLSTKQPDGSWVITSGNGSAQPFAPASGVNSIPQWTGLVVLGNNNCH